MNSTPPTEPPTLEDVAVAGGRRTKDVDRLKKSSDDLKEVVLAVLREGRYRPTEVAKASGWTGAHVRKMAREAGIEPDERYKERAERLKKTRASEEQTA